MSDPAEDDPVRRPEARNAVDVVMRYHQDTKHHFSRYARSLGYLDWANQPDPFRRYGGSPLRALPHLKPDVSPLYQDLYRGQASVSAPVTLRSLSRFLEYSLAISAWKQAGAVRWALRTNPSSGNLHPTEGYLLIGAVPNLSPFPGVFHYSPKEHALELRAELPQTTFDSLMREFPPSAFLVAFASVYWRETWKYGERAFRYCQHDAGHAIGGARIAAQALGWRMLLLDGVSDDTVARLLGLDRAQDFEEAEREHPDCCAVVWPSDQAVGRAAGGSITLPLSFPPDAVREGAQPRWHGKANRLSRDDPVPWEILEQVAVASWKSGTERRIVELNNRRPRVENPTDPGGARTTGLYRNQITAGQVIRQRRSALAFDGKTSISIGCLFNMLARVMPRADRGVCERPMPWDALPWQPCIHLALFVHRVEGLVPGLYMLARDGAKADSLKRATHQQYAWTAPPGCPTDLPLFLLEAGDVRPLATELSCRQEIAGDGAFSLAMIAEYESSLRRHGPWFYRRLFWETGVIGQVLYLEAEAAGVRATGIGCFFDDPVHQVMGFEDASFQSLYHFTLGAHVEDPRLTTLPPYDLDH